jgi:hypothetical protein
VSSSLPGMSEDKRRFAPMTSMLIFAAGAALLIYSGELISSAEKLTVHRRERPV